MSPVLPTTFSLKHETDMKKSFLSLVEAQQKAKNVRLTREQTAKCIRETRHGRFAWYGTARGQHVTPDDFRGPDFRQLIQVAQTELLSRVDQRCLVSLSSTVQTSYGLDP